MKRFPPPDCFSLECLLVISGDIAYFIGTMRYSLAEPDSFDRAVCPFRLGSNALFIEYGLIVPDSVLDS